MPVTFQVVGNLADFGNEPRAGVKVRATASPGIKVGNVAVHSNQPETVVTDGTGAFTLELVSLPGVWYRIHTPYSGGLPTINLAGYVPDVDDRTTGTAFPPDTVVDVKDVANEDPTPGYEAISVASWDTLVGKPDLADVATSGEYADLTGTPTLGTAAATDATDYATAAQGALADAAASTYDRQGMAQKSLTDHIRRGRLGVIGTFGRPVIAIRIDHCLDGFRTNIAPLLKARYLPFSFGVVTGSVENPTAGYEPTTSTWAQLKTDVHHIGGDIWAHSRTHSNGASFEDEIVGAKADLEAQGFAVMGWQQPGNPATYGPAHVNQAAMDDEPGRLIRKTYGLYESSFSGTKLRTLPTDGARGHDHVTIDGMTLADAKAWVDKAILYGKGLEFMLHPSLIGTAGFMSLTDLGLLLDYIKAKWDADLVEVMTATGLALADPSSTYRPSIMPYGSFEGLTTGSPPEEYVLAGAAYTISTDGGRTGTNYLRVPSGVAVCTIDAWVIGGGVAGHTFLFEGWVRGSDPAGVKWRVSMTAGVPAGNVTMQNVTSPVTLPQSTEWTRVRIPFSIPADATRVNVNIGAGVGSAAADWDDVRVIAI